MNTTTRYEQDIVAWAHEQAGLLRAGRLDLLDLEHLADEIEDVGRSEQRELASRMAVLLAHLLKWQYQPGLHEGSRSSWLGTVKARRERIARRLRRTPSLKHSLSDPDWWQDAWDDALDIAVKETGLDRAQFPQGNPWRTEDILDDGWLPA